MITLTAEQAQQIEEALVAMCNSLELPEDSVQALATIRAARAQEQAEQEPVGYFAYDEEHDIWEELTGPNAPGATPLYAAPVRTKDLTDDEIDEIYQAAKTGNLLELRRAVIAAYKEKNR